MFNETIIPDDVLEVILRHPICGNASVVANGKHYTWNRGAFGISEIRVFNRSLTLNEIATLWKGVSYYHFEEDDGEWI